VSLFVLPSVFDTADEIGNSLALDDAVEHKLCTR
jgi:hypothetical protein